MFFRNFGHLTGAVCVALLLGGCAGHEFENNEVATGAISPDAPLSATASIPPADERPQDQPVALGRQHFAKSDYGLAERYFRQAVEANPKSSEAWVGLAASYDRLRRFELAERAYKQVLALEGRTPAVLNNLGYHHMLRGNLKQARHYLNEALRRDPTNPQIQGNLRLLETWKSGGENAHEPPPEQG